MPQPGRSLLLCCPEGGAGSTSADRTTGASSGNGNRLRQWCDGSGSGRGNITKKPLIKRGEVRWFSGLGLGEEIGDPGEGLSGTRSPAGSSSFNGGLLIGLEPEVVG